MEIEKCNCLETVEKNLIEMLSNREDNPKKFTIVESEWEYKSWFPTVRLYVNYIVKSTFEKKNGTTSKPRNEHVSIFFTYCPFCGKQIKEQSSELMK